MIRFLTEHEGEEEGANDGNDAGEVPLLLGLVVFAVVSVGAHLRGVGSYLGHVVLLVRRVE